MTHDDTGADQPHDVPEQLSFDEPETAPASPPPTVGDAAMAVNSLQKQPGRGPGRPFVKGQSGNPAGRPPGSRNPASIICQELLEGELEPLVRKMVEVGKGGNVAALRFVLSRLLLPPQRERIEFEMPKLETLDDCALAIQALLDAATSGRLSVADAKVLVDIVQQRIEIPKYIDWERRLAALEAKYALAEQLIGEMS